MEKPQEHPVGGIPPHLAMEKSVKMSARQVIDSINSAVTQSQRKNILTTATSFFNHSNAHVHDSEIEMGAANALCLKLGYVLLQSNCTAFSLEDCGRGSSSENFSSTRPSSHQQEVGLICHVLCMIYSHCSERVREESFQEMGGSELLPLLIQVLERNRYHRGVVVATTTNPPHCGVEAPATRYSLLVLRSFAKIQSLKPVLVQWGNGRLLSTIVSLLQLPHTAGKENLPSSSSPTTPVGALSLFSSETYSLLLSLLKDLTFRSADPAKMSLFHHPHLIPTLISLAGAALSSRNVASENKKNLETVSAIFWNLAVCSPLQSAMAQATSLVNSLVSLAGTTDAVIVSKRTQSNALSAIGNLATADSDDVRQALIQQRSGVLDMLRSVLENDSTTGAAASTKGVARGAEGAAARSSNTAGSAKRRAARTIRCLTDGRESAIEIGKRLAMVTMLGTVAVSDEDGETRLQCAEALGGLARHIFIEDNGRNSDRGTTSAAATLGQGDVVAKALATRREIFKQLLKTINDSTNDTVVEISSRGLLAALVPVATTPAATTRWLERHADDDTSSFLHAISKSSLLSQSTPVTREQCSRVFRSLSGSRCHHKALVSNASVLDALSFLLVSQDDTTRRLAAQTVGAMVECGSEDNDDDDDERGNGEGVTTTRGVLAAHETLLTNLVEFVLLESGTTTTRGRETRMEDKEKAKGVILTLVPEL
mmetsp:Transcript_34872/g.42639  ORF Transcript_34872/g.42639 Transcript_34872/m.42639 type:complete len:712 (+) Transcript_34872:209-2344(+)